MASEGQYIQPYYKRPVTPTPPKHQLNYPEGSISVGAVVPIHNLQNILGVFYIMIL